MEDYKLRDLSASHTLGLSRIKKMGIASDSSIIGFGLGFLENRIRNFGLGSPIEKTETE